MESDVEGIGYKEYTFSIKDLENFGDLVRKIEGECEFCKVIITDYVADSKDIVDTDELECVVIQNASKLEYGAYEVSNDKEKTMIYSKFIEKSTEMKQLYGLNDDLSIEEQEDLFWENIGTLPGLYSIDNSKMSLFGEKCKIWNLNELNNADSIIHNDPHSKKKSIVPGVNTPFVYVAGPMSSFGFHLEDVKLSGISFLHFGGVKIWYLVGKKYHPQLEQLAAECSRKIDCNFYIRHKTLMIPPSVLKANGIEFARIKQYPGEFFLTFGNGYHSGINIGLNAAEAVNFATYRWKEIYPEFTTCKHYKYSIQSILQALEPLIFAPAPVSRASTSPLCCEVCGTSFGMQKNLNAHTRKFHGNFINEYECPKCPGSKNFSSPYSLKYHLREEHGIEIDQDVAEGFVKQKRNTPKQKEKLLIRKQNKIRRTELTCDICGKKAHGKSNMKRHMNIHIEILKTNQQSASKIKIRRSIHSNNKRAASNSFGKKVQDIPNIKFKHDLRSKTSEILIKGSRRSRSNTSTPIRATSIHSLTLNKRATKAQNTCSIKRSSSPSAISKVKKQKNKKSLDKTNLEQSLCEIVPHTTPIQLDIPQSNSDVLSMNSEYQARNELVKVNFEFPAGAQRGVEKHIVVQENVNIAAESMEEPDAEDKEREKSGVRLKTSKRTKETSKTRPHFILPQITSTTTISTSSNDTADKKRSFKQMIIKDLPRIPKKYKRSETNSEQSLREIENVDIAADKKRRSKQMAKEGERGASINFRNFSALKMEKLTNYELPYEITDLVFNNVRSHLKFFEDLVEQRREDADSYMSAFTKLLYMEEAANNVDSNALSLRNVRVEIQWIINSMENCLECLCKINIDSNMAKFRSAIKNGIDKCTMKFAHIPGASPIYGQFTQCSADGIFVKIHEGFEDIICHRNLFFDINFFKNQLSYQLQHRALKYITDHKLFSILIKNISFATSHAYQQTPSAVDHVFSCSNSDTLNDEQRTAVKFIVDAHNIPMPYLLVGPPGTGKTRTITAAVEEIVLTTDKYVLICSQSNAACDEITNRLLCVLKKGELFRMYAKTFNLDLVNSKIREISNMVDGEFVFPALKHLYRFRVVICTLQTAGCIPRSRELDPDFKSSHFSYIIIDEAGVVTEPMTMIAIAGLCTEVGEVKSSIVFAGDPKQLDPVITSKHASKLGLKNTYMEYLSKQELYKPHHGKYDPLFITALKKNYRSHELILHIPNKKFYRSELEAHAQEAVKNWFIGTDLLLNKSFPIIFKSIDGSESKYGTSYYNDAEIDEVLLYVQKLLQSEWNNRSVFLDNIGIVSPYKGQCDKLKERCKENAWDRLAIGSAETFQGQEREIMIVSTVRTGDELGFVANKKRFNVMVTRAKSLLIIIGKHKLLNNNKYWRSMIEFCSKNRALSQNGIILKPRITFEDEDANDSDDSD